jgi:hypothetical protein
MLAQKNARNLTKSSLQEEFSEMAKRENRDQVIVHISMENGIPRLRQLTPNEQKQFFKTHPKSKLPTFTLDHLNRILMTDPSTISLGNDPSAR